MKQKLINGFVVAFSFILLIPASLLAQKEEKDKEVKEKKDVQQIIITRKNDKGEKIVIEINGDKVTVNGKSLDEYKDKNGDLTVRLQKLKELEGLARVPGMGSGWSFHNNRDNLNYYSEESNHAMLGVTTEKSEQGVVIRDISDESAAQKAGLKENDIITKIDDTKINDPDELSVAIKKHKPGDKVTVSYLRDNKELKVTAELTKWKGINMLTKAPGFKMDMGDLNMERIMPAYPTVPDMKTPFYKGFTWTGSGPKLGISVQDTEVGKGVKVTGVDEESNAEKAGIKEDDIITEVDGKTINNTDDITKIIRESKEKNSVMIKLLRSGKTQHIEVKMPRKLKQADL